MVGGILFLTFVVLLFGGVPIGVALGIAGALAIQLADQSILAMPTNVYTGIAKYPLIAIPMFVLVGSVFDRTGVALRLVRFASAIVGAGRGALASVSVLVAMVIGGISGSGPATSTPWNSRPSPGWRRKSTPADPRPAYLKRDRGSAAEGRR